MRRLHLQETESVRPAAVVRLHNKEDTCHELLLHTEEPRDHHQSRRPDCAETCLLRVCKMSSSAASIVQGQIA